MATPVYWHSRWLHPLFALPANLRVLVGNCLIYQSIFKKTSSRWLHRPSLLAIYVVAILLPMAAAGIRAALEPVFSQNAPFLLFVVAIILSAGFGGTWPGLVTTATSTLLVSYFFGDSPSGRVLLGESSRNLTRFFAIGTLISLLIGELRRALALRTQSDEKFRALFNSMDEGFAYAEMIYDEEGRPVDCRYLEANPAFGREAGVTIDQIVGHTLREIAPDIEPFWFEHYDRVVRTGHSGHAASRVGSLGKHFETFAWRTGPGRFAVIFSDATERLKLESENRRFAAIIQTTNDAVIGLDLGGIVTTWNPAAEAAYGYSASEMIGQPMSRLLPPEEAVGQEAIALRLSLSSAIENYETILVRNDGQQVDVSVTVSPILDEKGNRVGYSQISRDISKSKQAADSLKRSLDEKSALLQEVHHRVKNNLQIICSLLALEADSLKDEGVSNKLHEMELRVTSMAMIHRTLYEQNDMSSIDLGEFGRNLAAQLVSCHSSNPSITHHTEASPTFLLIEQAIPCGLILNELITNALKYAYPVGPGEILISISSDGDDVCLRVSDQGKGMPPNFDLETSGSLGITLIHALTAQLDGQLELGGPPGASFSVRFRRKSLQPMGSAASA